ncbi:hypothetical protein [Luteolibacter sp. LG18]|uniref:hypothetical protein n=1 Tax=Luteolibacter sp. LG18 TaxID=2819286 RepID=UPI0030C77F5D
MKGRLAAGLGPAGEETFHPLVERPGLLLEEIVSRGQPTPEGEWYDQERDEWVLLAKGRATLVFDPGGPMELETGEHVLIPARLRHRVERVSVDAVWLALHFDPALRDS